MKHSSGLVLLLSGLALWQTGCVTPYQQARMKEQASEREDQLLLRENIRRLDGRVEGVELQNEALFEELDRARGDQRRAVDDQVADLRRNLSDLERRLGELESAQRRDKEEILANVSKTISKVLKPTSRSSTPSRGPSTGYGYEHTVQSGETLSAIAKAYGVTVKRVMESNDLTNPNQLRVGQVLFIPE